MMSRMTTRHQRKNSSNKRNEKLRIFKKTGRQRYEIDSEVCRQFTPIRLFYHRFIEPGSLNFTGY